MRHRQRLRRVSSRVPLPRRAPGRYLGVTREGRRLCSHPRSELRARKIPSWGSRRPWVPRAQEPRRGISELRRSSRICSQGPRHQRSRKIPSLGSVGLRDCLGQGRMVGLVGWRLTKATGSHRRRLGYARSVATASARGRYLRGARVADRRIGWTTGKPATEGGTCSHSNQGPRPQLDQAGSR